MIVLSLVHFKSLIGLAPGGILVYEKCGDRNMGKKSRSLPQNENPASKCGMVSFEKYFGKFFIKFIQPIVFFIFLNF